MPITITCLHCGKPAKFSPSNVRKFCSRACRNAHTHVQKICVICGSPFENVASRVVEQVTCRSEACKKAIIKKEHKPNYGRRRYTYTCLRCGKSVSTSSANRQFCSKECNYAYKQTRKDCVICGKSFECAKSHAHDLVTCGSEECKKAIYHQRVSGRHLSKEAKDKISKANSKPRIEVDCTCGCGEKVIVPEWKQRKNKTGTFFVDQVHMFKWRQGENHWNYRGGRSYYGRDWKIISQSIRERDKVCQICGTTPEANGRTLHVHHKIPYRVSHNNSPDNLTALCGSCHQTLQAIEQRMYPHKVMKRRKCLVCGTVFTPKPFQKFCSAECHRKRVNQWHKKHLATHPEAYRAHRQRIANWQKANKDRVNELHQQSRLRRRSPQA